MDPSWKTGECHFTWDLKEIPKVSKIAHKMLRNIHNNLAETDFLKIEHLLFKAFLQSWFKNNVSDARESLNQAKLEIEKRRSEDVYKGYKSVELLNRMWIEHNVSHHERVRELHEELKTIKLEENDRQIVGAIKAAAVMRLGPVMFDFNLKLFTAAHQACPSNPDFLFRVAFVTGQKMRSLRQIGSRFDNSDQFLKNLMDEEKDYWEKLIDMKPNHKGYHYAKSMLGLNLSRRDKPEDKEKALRLLEEAYNNAPDIHEVCRNLTRFLKKTDLDRSVSILETTISKQPARKENHHQLALCYIEKAKQEQKKRRRCKAEKWNKKALTELNECSHVYALLNKAKHLQYLEDPNESPADIYENMMQKSKDFTLDEKLQLYSNFASYLRKTKSASRYSSRFNMSQEVMNISTDESFEYQNESGKWETKNKHKRSKTDAYKALKKHYESEKDHLQLGILFYQNFEFDQAIDTLATVDKTNADVPYYLAKSYLKKGQEKTVGDQAKPEEAADDFARSREKVQLARELGLEPQKVRKILADTALAIAHNELQVNVEYADNLEDHPETSIIRLEDRCVTSYREAVRCGSLVAVLELMKLFERGFIKIITSRSRFIQILAEVEVCCSQPQSDALHAESKPLTFKEGLRSKETNTEPCMLKNRKKIKGDVKRILSKDTFFRESRDALFNMEVQLLKERFEAIDGSDGLQLDGREEGPLEDVSKEIKTKAVLCCRETRPLLDRIMEKFQKEVLGMDGGQGNYFPLILEDKKLTPETLKNILQEKLKQLTCIDMETHYPKIYECILKLQPTISAENKFLWNYWDVVNTKKHSNKDVLAIEPNPVKLARQSTDKVEEVCTFFFRTITDVKTLRTRVEDLVAAIRQGGYEEVDKAADELFEVLMKNEVFVVRIDNTWTFLEMLALIRHCREAAGADLDLTRWTELSERNSGFSKELRKSYLEVEAALLTNGGGQSSMEVLVECHKTCIEADKLLNKSLQSEGNRNKTNFPFPEIPPGKNKASWKGKVNQHLSKDLRTQGITDYLNLLDTILEAQPCSNEDNYHFIAMQKFRDDPSVGDWSKGTAKDTVSIEKGTNSPVSYDVLKLTRWCVNHAEKLASKVMARM